jgi:SH3-like domain-containing protein
MKTSARPAALVTALLCATALLAYEAGGTAYTKRVETKLLSEPKPMAEAAGKLAFGRKVKVEQVQGAWLRISDGPTAGWVFAGNLSATAPNEGKGLDGLPVAASETTATAAARPLTPAAVEYAGRRNLTDARGDLDWLLEQCQSITPEDVEAFLQEKKKGEFQ